MDYYLTPWCATWPEGPRDYMASLRATRRVYGPASPVNSLRPNATASPPGVPRPVDSVDGLATGVCVLGGPALPWPCPPRIRFPVRRRSLLLFRSPQATMSSL